ncbi:hypothetical protein DVH24_027308 [Malus domestica]|uniref:Uncharacterized protein n=1 Tax=Malus domestica TaxID=3750 RepID=A0A498IMM6_MALDO|nr:hypothetical protein DVH24_027308 [Malus domestica]
MTVRGGYGPVPTFKKKKRSGPGRAFVIFGSGRFLEYMNRGYPDRPVYGQTSVPRQLPSLDSAKIDVDDQSVEPVEELEKKRSQKFQKILEVSKEERDRVQRMQVVDRAAAAIAAARAILEDKNNELRTEAGDRGGSGGGSGGGGDGTIGARQEGKDLDIVFDF